MRCGSAKRISKVKVLGSCAGRVLSKQTKQGCGSIQAKVNKVAWFGVVLSAMVGCKVKVLG